MEHVVNHEDVVRLISSWMNVSGNMMTKKWWQA